MSTSFHLQYVRGDDRPYTFTFTDSTGTAIDVSNWTFWLTAKWKYEDADADAVIQVTKEPPHDGSNDDPTNGKVVITIPSDAVSDDQEPGTLLCDIQRKDGSGNIRTIVVGVLEIQPDVTRTTTTS